MAVLDVMSALLVSMVGIGLVVILVLYIVDANQALHAMRRNYPGVGRFRYCFLHVGVFFRQYFFAMDVKKCHLTGRNAPGFIVS